MNESNVTIIDAIMGTGKTRWAVNTMSESYFGSGGEGHEELTSYLYITPRIEDYQDVQRRCEDVCEGLTLWTPKQVEGSKMKHLLSLIQSGKTIASTHALFKLINQDMLDVLAERDYTLIVDEETEWVHEYTIRPDDARGLFEAEFIYVDNKHRVRWNYNKWPKYNGSKWAEVKQLCDNGNLIRVDDTFLVWELPIAFLDAFEHVYIMTYMFEGSVLSAYFKSNDRDYTIKTLDTDSNLVDFDGGHARRRKAEIAKLVTICDDNRLNSIGTPRKREHPLSANWMGLAEKTGDDRLVRLQKATYNYYRNHCNGTAGMAMWSTFKSYQTDLKGSGYAKAFTPVNLKATNKYMERSNLAYLANIFMRPRLTTYFEGCGVVPDQELYAVSQLVQWMWRSRIRVHQPINIFLPSERMRKLFKAWLVDEFKPQLRHISSVAQIIPTKELESA